MPDPTQDTRSFRSTLSVLSLTQLLSWAVLYYAFSSMLLPMQRELGWSSPQLMGAFTLALTAWGAASYAAGALIDREQARRVMGGAPVLAAIGLLMWADAQAPWQLYAALLLCGVAMAGALYEAAFSTVTRRFPRRYRGAITTLTLAGGFASTLAFPLFAALIPAVGWRDALRWMALLMVGVALANAWALRPLPRTADASTAPPPSVMAAGGLRYAEAVRGAPFWLLTACFMLHAFVIAAFWVHAVAAFDAKGWPQAEAVGVLAWIGPAQVLGRAALALGGRVGSPRTVGMAVLAGMVLAMLLFAAARDGASMLVFAALYGGCAGMATIVRGTSVPERFGLRDVARIAGLLSAFALAGRAAAPLLSAWLLDLVGGYRAWALVMAAVALLSLAAYVRATRPTVTGASRA